jgi:hypothetical protein
MLNPNLLKKLKKVKPKKSYKPKSEGKLGFFTFTSIHESFRFVTFFWFDFFCFFQRIWIQNKILRLLVPFISFAKNFFFRSFKHFFETLEQNSHGMAKKNKKCFF